MIIKTFYVTDFSIKTWLQDFGLSETVDTVPDYVASILLDDMDIFPYLMSESCTIGDSPFYNVGWNSGKWNMPV